MVKVSDFDTSDETDDSILEALDWWMMALMPSIPLLGFVTDESQGDRLDRLYRSAGLMTVTGSALYLAGAGSSMYNPATVYAGAAMQVEKYRMLASGAARTGGAVGRGVLRSLPLVTAYFAVRGYFHHLASLDWMPDVYQV